MHEDCEGEANEAELRQRRVVGERHQGKLAARGADEGQARLQQRHEERQDQGVVAELHDHRDAPFLPDVSCQCPDFFSASATSGGM